MTHNNCYFLLFARTQKISNQGHSRHQYSTEACLDGHPNIAADGCSGQVHITSLTGHASIEKVHTHNRNLRTDNWQHDTEQAVQLVAIISI